jgi:hypothetical protein
MKYSLIVLFLFMVLKHAWSQDGDFIELKNGDVIHGSKIEYKSPVFKSAYLLVDEKDKYELIDVAAYQINKAYFKRLTPTGVSYSGFYLRTAHGKIDAFVKTSANFVMQPNGTMSNVSNRWDFYSVEGGPLKKTRYRFLRKELKDSKAAMKILNEIRAIRYVSAGLYLGGTALIVTGIANASGKSGIPSGLIAGAAAFGVNRLLLDVKRNKLSDAIEAYNSEFR